MEKDDIISQLQIELDRTKRVLADKENLMTHVTFRIEELKADYAVLLKAVYPLLELYRSLSDQEDKQILIKAPAREGKIGGKKHLFPEAKLTVAHLKEIWRIWSTPAGHQLLDKLSKLITVYEIAKTLDVSVFQNNLVITPDSSVQDLTKEFNKFKQLDEAITNINIPNICCVSEYSCAQASKCSCHRNIADIQTTEPTVEKLEYNNVTLYTDGACSGNPGRGGYAFVITIDEEIYHEDSGFKKSTTNNEMELSAVVNGLDFLKERDITMKELKVISDSQYVIQGMKSWINNWIKNDWKTSSGNLVPNYNLWNFLYNIVKYFEKQENPTKILWQHVIRNSLPLQAKCDQLAKKEITINKFS